MSKKDMKNNEQENNELDNLDDLFQSNDIKNVVKKAKRKSTLRNIFISTTVSLVVLGGLYIGNQTLLNKVGWEVETEIQQFHRITDPNSFTHNSQFQYGFLNGLLEYKTYKVIEDRVIPWEENKIDYNILGNYSRMIGQHGDIQINETVAKPDFYNPRFYNVESGENSLLFYHPALQYKTHINDLTKLNELGDDKYIEMALSFDKGYSLNEVNQMLPKGVDATWYWVNSMTQKQIKQMEGVQFPEREKDVYGFQSYSDVNAKDLKTTEQDFVQNVEAIVKANNHYSAGVRNLYDAIKENKKNGFIVGVVVTGTKQELASLSNRPFIKAAVLGVTIDKN